MRNAGGGWGSRDYGTTSGLLFKTNQILDTFETSLVKISVGTFLFFQNINRNLVRNMLAYTLNSH